MRGAVPPIPNMLPRRGAQLKKKAQDNFTFTLRVHTFENKSES